MDQSDSFFVTSSICDKPIVYATNHYYLFAKSKKLPDIQRAFEGFGQNVERLDSKFVNYF